DQVERRLLHTGVYRRRRDACGEHPFVLVHRRANARTTRHEQLQLMSANKVPAPERLKFCIDWFEKRGVPPEGARLVAENLIFANLRGVDSHGVIRLKVYCDRLRAGGFKLNVRPQVVAEDASTAVVDGEGGIGQAAAKTAMNLALGKAESTGL